MRLKPLATALFRYSGAFWIWRKLQQDKIIILAIHGTGESSVKNQWTPLRTQLGPAELERIFKLLAPYYRFVSLDTAVDMLRGTKPMLRNCVAVTFDDGYRNNVKFALPVLKKENVRPTIFLATRHIDERIPHWFDRLDYALQRGASDGRAFSVGGSTIRVSTSSRSALAESYSQIRQQAKRAARDDREMLLELNSIAEELEQEESTRLADIVEQDDWSALLTWQEIRESQGDVDYGSHTVDHIRVGAVEAEVALDQLSESKKRIEQESGKECSYFAYPDGNYTPEAMKLCWDCGYKAAVTMDPGLNGPGSDPMALKRIAVPIGAADNQILAELSGFWNWLRG